MKYNFEPTQLTVSRPGKDDQSNSYVTSQQGALKTLVIQQVPPIHGVYSLNGDTLQICVMVDEARQGQFPAALISQASPATDLLTLQRDNAAAPTTTVAPPSVAPPAPATATAGGDAKSRRTIWRYTNVPKVFPDQNTFNGVFRLKENKLWMEEERDGAADQDYQEFERTSEYVELFRPQGGFRVRLYDDHADYRYAADTEWKPMFSGRWE